MKFIGFAVRGGKTNNENSLFFVFLCRVRRAQGLQTLFPFRFIVLEQEP
jgi:hypothetical protein